MGMLAESYSPILMVILPVILTSILFAVKYNGQNYWGIVVISALGSAAIYMISLLAFEKLSALFIIGMADVLMLYAPIALVVGGTFVLVRRMRNRRGPQP